MSADVPFGWQEVVVSSDEMVVVRNGKVYLQREGEPPLYLGSYVTELSGHDWVSSETVTGRDGEGKAEVRQEFKEPWSTLADRPVEAEWLGFSSRLEDERYMEVQPGERVCDRCFMVISKAITFCEWCS